MNKNFTGNAPSVSDHSCPAVEFVNLISGKWAIPILYRLIAENKPVRFSVLQRATTPITQKELTRHLRLFEQQGLITRHVYPEVPLRVEYEITDIGRTLKPMMQALAEWMVVYGTQIKGCDDLTHQ